MQDFVCVPGDLLRLLLVSQDPRLWRVLEGSSVVPLSRPSAVNVDSAWPVGCHDSHLRGEEIRGQARFDEVTDHGTSRDGETSHCDRQQWLAARESYQVRDELRLWFCPGLILAGVDAGGDRVKTETSAPLLPLPVTGRARVRVAQVVPAGTQVDVNQIDASSRSKAYQAFSWL